MVELHRWHIDGGTAEMRSSVFGLHAFCHTLFSMWKTTERHFLKTSMTFILCVMIIK